MAVDFESLEPIRCKQNGVIIRFNLYKSPRHNFKTYLEGSCQYNKNILSYIHSVDDVTNLVLERNHIINEIQREF